MNTSKIQWTDSTHNFWRGCTKVSAGCKNCYAEKNVGVKMAGIKWGQGQPRVKSKNFEAPLAWNSKPWICEVCGRSSDRRFDHSCTGRPEDARHTDNVPWHLRRVFSLSLGDWLDPEVPIEWLAQMLDVIRRCPNLTWQFVTKRPDYFFARLRDALVWAGDHDSPDSELVSWLHDWVNEFIVPPNIWVIVSAENQQTFDQRVPFLLSIPAVVHGLSCEPLLGPIDFKQSLGQVEIQSLNGITGACDYSGGIDWVIVGGESGKDARRCDTHWIANIARQCNAKVPCFIKQFGGHLSDDDLNYCASSSGKSMHDKKGGDMAEWPADLRIRQFPD